MPLPGDIIGHYRIEALLGEGAFGSVFRGEDLRLGRKVAIKVPHVKGEEDPAAWGLVLQEARAASALNHPNICATYDIGEDGGLHYIALEYIEGRTLTQLVRPVPLTADIALSYASQIAYGLEHAHAHGIIHRDLKASNVIITPSGQAKLLDFGLAQRLDPGAVESLTRSRQSLAEIGNIAGTLSYMAPEVLRGKPAGPSSDLWSLGALLHEMLSAQLPFKGETPFELTMSIMVEAPGPLPPNVPAAVRSIVEKCLEKEPKDRFRDAAELLKCLDTARSSIAGLQRKGLLRQARLGIALVSLLAVLGLAFARRRHEAKPIPPPKIEVVQKAPARAEAAVKPPTAQASPVQTRRRPSAPPASAPSNGNPNVEVWVNLKTNIYHCPGTRWFKKTADGTLLKQRDAQHRGYHPASNAFCE